MIPLSQFPIPILRFIYSPFLLLKVAFMSVYTRCWSQDIKENIWNAISLISHSMYKATYFQIKFISCVSKSAQKLNLKVKIL